MSTTPSLRHHRLFDVHDILIEIFEHLAEMNSGSNPSRQGCRNLARAAICSKTLSAPALDVLWKHLDSELPFLKLLPGFQKVENVWVSIFRCNFAIQVVTLHYIIVDLNNA
jgi:hypothetical protein